MVALAVVLTDVLAACDKTASENKGNEQVPTKPVLTVNVTHLAQQIWPRAAAANSAVQPWQETSIGAGASGLKLAEMLANVDDTVKRGQLLTRLSDETIHVDVVAQYANLAETEASAAQVTDETHRAHELDESGAISQQDLMQYDT